MAVTLWKWQIYIYREKVACSHHNNSKNYQANSNLSRKHHKIEATSQTSRGFLCALKVYLFFLTSTAFVSTNAKYGIPHSRYTVFLQNCPLEHCSNTTSDFLIKTFISTVSLVIKQELLCNACIFTERFRIKFIWIFAVKIF